MSSRQVAKQHLVESGGRLVPELVTNALARVGRRGTSWDWARDGSARQGTWRHALDGVDEVEGLVTARSTPSLARWTLAVVSIRSGGLSAWRGVRRRTPRCTSWMFGLFYSSASSALAARGNVAPPGTRRNEPSGTPRRA